MEAVVSPLQIHRLLTDIEKMRRTTTPVAKMYVYRNIFATFCDYTQKVHQNRQNFLRFVEVCGFGECLFPEIPTKARTALILKALDSMVLDSYFRSKSLSGLCDDTLAKGFEIFIISEEERRGSLFIWNEEKVLDTWVYIQGRCFQDPQQLHWTVVKKTAENIQMKNQPQDKNTTDSETDIENKQLYAFTSSIYMDMFCLPSNWDKDQIVHYVTGHHANK
jgi:hypothetical protein